MDASPEPEFAERNFWQTSENRRSSTRIHSVSHHTQNWRFGQREVGEERGSRANRLSLNSRTLIHAVAAAVLLTGAIEKSFLLIGQTGHTVMVQLLQDLIDTPLLLLVSGEFTLALHAFPSSPPAFPCRKESRFGFGLTTI